MTHFMRENSRKPPNPSFPWADNPPDPLEPGQQLPARSAPVFFLSGGFSFAELWYRVVTDEERVKPTAKLFSTNTDGPSAK